MATLELKLEDDQKVFVEVKADRLQEVSNKKLEANFDKVSGSLGAVVKSLEAQLSAMPKRPDTFEIEMGAELKGEADFWIVNGTAGAHFKVTLKWGK